MNILTLEFLEWWPKPLEKLKWKLCPINDNEKSWININETIEIFHAQLFFYWHWEWLQLFMKFNIVHTVIKYVTVAQFDFHNSNYSEDKQNKPQQNNLPSFCINNFSSKHTSLNRIWLICKLTFNWTHYLYKKNNIHLLNKYLKIDIGKLIWLDCQWQKFRTKMLSYS